MTRGGHGMVNILTQTLRSMNNGAATRVSLSVSPLFQGLTYHPCANVWNENVIVSADEANYVYMTY